MKDAFVMLTTRAVFTAVLCLAVPILMVGACLVVVGAVLQAAWKVWR